MVDTARSVGASAKFTGSGGAIVGTYEDEAMYAKLTTALEGLGLKVFKPLIDGGAGMATPERAVADSDATHPCGN